MKNVVTASLNRKPGDGGRRDRDASSGMDASRPTRAAAILSDIQFWVPVAVLAVGALILYWVSR